jgi:ATP/maltotriose-dependent transcriptional regulator MalT
VVISAGDLLGRVGERAWLRREGRRIDLAAGGLTNPETGGQLFLSPRTVEWHLRKVFGKLGIGSRKELRSALTDGPALVPS